MRSFRGKITLDGKPWTTKLFPKDETSQIYNCYPIYDWRTEDIWRANGKNKWDYNRIYDIMHMAGVSIYKQRLCQPYGDDQRQGLYLFKILEPETWAKVVNRVEGANFGNRYTETDRTTLGNFKVNLPPGHTYESYAKFLLDTMPPYLAEHYRKKIDRFLEWWENEGVASIQDYADIKDEAKKKVPSWRRICKVLLKNDYWCKGLSFSQTKKELEKRGFVLTDSKANFLFAKCEKIDGEELYLKLKEKHILVRHFTTDKISQYNRITIGSKEQMKALVKALTEILEVSP